MGDFRFPVKVCAPQSLVKVWLNEIPKSHYPYGLVRKGRTATEGSHHRDQIMSVHNSNSVKRNWMSAGGLSVAVYSSGWRDDEETPCGELTMEN